MLPSRQLRNRSLVDPSRPLGIASPRQYTYTGHWRGLGGHAGEADGKGRACGAQFVPIRKQKRLEKRADSRSRSREEGETSPGHSPLLPGRGHSLLHALSLHATPSSPTPRLARFPTGRRSGTCLA